MGLAPIFFGFGIKRFLDSPFFLRCRRSGGFFLADDAGCAGGRLEFDFEGPAVRAPAGSFAVDPGARQLFADVR